MLEQLHVLHYNVGKRKQAQWSLLNDKDLEKYDVLAVVEPYIYPDVDTGKPRVPNHSN